MYSAFARCFVTAVLSVGLTAPVAANDLVLPPTVAWSAYPTGTSGYSQAVAIGSVLQNEYAVNLRVVPGRNDIARLAPLRSGHVQFAAGGSEAVYAQEGMLNFGVADWGPTPIRSVAWNISDGCSFTFGTGADAGIVEPADMQGKRLTYVKGAPSLNNASRALLAYAELTWDDVEIVEVGGYSASIQAVVEGRADAAGGSCNSASFLQVEASPRGLRFVTFPSDDAEAVKRVTDILPWYLPHVATEGPTIEPAAGIEVFTSPYPYLVAMADTDADLVYNMVKAIAERFEDYRDAAPGAQGWAMDRQRFEAAFVPYHEGAVRYYKEQGLWSDAAEARQQQNLTRQNLLLQAWADYAASAPADAEAFADGWMQKRAAVLQDAGMTVIAERW